MTRIAQVLGCLREADLAAPPPFDAVKHVVNSWPLHDPAQFSWKELLERLSVLLGAPLQPDVYVFGDVRDENVRHVRCLYRRSRLASPFASAALATVIAVCASSCGVSSNSSMTWP